MLPLRSPCYSALTLVRGGTGGSLGLVVSASLAVLLGAAMSSSAQSPATSGAPIAPASTAPSSTVAPAGGEIEALRESVAILASRIDELSGGRTPPPWAVLLKTEIDGRVERLMEMQERLAARIETPLPRLDEPIILFTVAASTLVLGFVIGRSLQRRRDRRDGRFRL